ncbi:MAG: tetratricopeptide repeat protein [Bacteroidota bacterium]
MRYFLLFGLFLFSFSFQVHAQQSRLAQQYYQNGEYEKAASLYQKLYEQQNYNDYYFERYVECLISLEEYQTCEQAIKKQLKKRPEQVQLYVTYGNLFERQNQEADAKQQYQNAIKKLSADRFIVTKLANAFVRLTKYKLAIDTYERGGELLKDKTVFAYNLADLYRRQGNSKKMIEYYLNSVEANPSRLSSVKTLFQRYLEEEDFLDLQTQLYERIQDNRETPIYPELLSWVFIQRKDYKNAFRQVRALDRQNKENGSRVYQLANIAANAKDYDTAIKAFDYIAREKGVTSSYYIPAQQESLACKRKRIVEGYDYSMEDLRALEAEYNTFLDEFGRNKTTANILVELADLEAFYLNDLNKAIIILDQLIQFPGINPGTQANGKLKLADFYLMQGEIWEATLLYSQVDKAFKDDILGHEARFRNARLSYYAGDFQWAQTQFKVLKRSTSKLIANDALDLAVFITDNLGLDSTEASLKLYSEADLLVFQNRFDEAFTKLDSLLARFPDHSLQDDVLYMKAQIYKKQKNWTEAVAMYETIIEDHTDEIRADNALFELADLQENQLNNVERAKELYEKIFIDFSNSTFAVEARKRFRKLRGDNI